MSPTRTQRRQRAPAGKGFLARRFARDRGASTAIEFSLLIIPFALLVFAILESCISFAAQQVMANVADDVARLYRTGQLRADDMNREELEEYICDRMNILVSDACPTNLTIDFRQYDSFAEAAEQETRIEGGELVTSEFGFNPGPATSRNMLRVYYEWPVMTDILKRSMSTLNGGKTLHFASVTWQNEPYEE